MYIISQLNLESDSVILIGIFYYFMMLIYWFLAFKIPIERKILVVPVVNFIMSGFIVWLSFGVKLPASFSLPVIAIGIINLLILILYSLILIVYSILTISRGQGLPKLMLAHIFYVLGAILLTQGWRLYPILEFNELLVFGIIIYLCYKDIKELLN